MLHAINSKNKKWACLVVGFCCSLFMNQVLPAAQKDNHRTERYRSVEASSKIHDVVHSFNGSSAQYITTGERRMLELRFLGAWEQGQYHVFQKPVSLDNKAVLFKWISSESDDASLMFAWMSSGDGFPGNGRGITAQLSQKVTTSGAAYFDVTLRTYDGTFSHVRVANGLFRCDPQACHEIVWSRDSEGLVFSFDGVQTRLSDDFNPFLNEVGHLKIGATGGRGEKVLRVLGQGSERYSPDFSALPTLPQPMMIQTAKAVLAEEPDWQWDFNDPSRSFKYTAKTNSEGMVYHFSSSSKHQHRDGSSHNWNLY